MKHAHAHTKIHTHTRTHKDSYTYTHTPTYTLLGSPGQGEWELPRGPCQKPTASISVCVCMSQFMSVCVSQRESV